MANARAAAHGDAPERTLLSPAFVLLLSVFVIATCGLVYELIAGALASYLLGDSVTQFSTIIGCYLFSMGIGSYASKFFTRDLSRVFIRVEILVGLVGGFSAAILFAAFEHVGSFRVLLYALVMLTGTLVGLEIPLLMRILRKEYAFRDLVSKVFTVDYIGALLASLIFPLVLVPHLGLVRSAFLFGILNVVVALWTLHLFRRQLHSISALQFGGILALLALVVGFAFGEQIMGLADASSFPDRVVYSKATHYQRIVLTQAPHDLRLFLNGNLQFSSRDEYRYHEALVHVGLAGIENPKRVLILGGGDGLAAREVFRYPSIESIRLVDLDPEMTRLFSNNDVLRGLNRDSLRNPKLAITNADAFVWLRANRDTFDFVIVDFPDPSNFSIGKLYSDAFYRELKRAVAPGGAVVIQSTSPYVAKNAFQIVDNTLASAGFRTHPYHTNVPSFGEWGYVLGDFGGWKIPTKYPEGLQYLSTAVTPLLLAFPADMRATDPAVLHSVNRLNNQILVRTFENEWDAYLH
ncbi:MAG: polyamine aminopropyltransferase [Bdellovibrionales bacterium]|nr:polyamine aminopropyltransferase [Bdellovibrionales bacterium]